MSDSLDLQTWEMLSQWLAQGQNAWLCTVTHTYGSAPRPVGSLFACNSRGERAGALVGGCLEEELLEQLCNPQGQEPAPRYLRYGGDDEESARLGLPCGGSLRLLVEHYRPDRQRRAHLSRILEALRARRVLQRRVDLRDGALSLHPPPAPPRPLEISARELRHTLGPPYRLLLIGASPVSACVARMALLLDYQLTVCDPRPDTLRHWDVAPVTVRRELPDDVIRKNPPDQYSMILALAHDPRIDDMGLMEALRSDALYVGAMGSRKNSAARRERLRALGLSAEQVARLRAPVGLSIGSKTPPEIALAILAELTALRSATGQQPA